METRVVTPPREGSAILVSPTFEKEKPMSAQGLPPIQLGFPELVAYVDRGVLLETHSGRQFDGVLQRVSGDRLWLSMNVGSGRVERSVSAEELKSLTLSSGQRIDLVAEGEGDAQVVYEDKPAAVSATPEPEAGPDEPAGEVSEKLAAFRRLVGKNVTITASDVPARTGILQAVTEDHLTLSVAVGAGNIEYFYDMNSIQNIEAAR